MSEIIGINKLRKDAIINLKQIINQIESELNPYFNIETELLAYTRHKSIMTVKYIAIQSSKYDSKWSMRYNKSTSLSLDISIRLLRDYKIDEILND